MLNNFRIFYISMLFLGLFLSGCSGTPTRHLVSDVCMIQDGKTSREEVLKLMGDPDSKRMVSAQIEEWVYYDESPTTLQSTPFVGGLFDPNGYNMVVITLSGDIVKHCRYSGYDDDEFDWRDDYSWQEIEKK
jgi:hypothetical protein